jgi:hypothetical protein
VAFLDALIDVSPDIQDPPRAETPIFAFTGRAGNVLKPEIGIFT